MKRVAVAVLALISLGQAQVNPPSQTLLQELQLPFTGRNGYEEYLMAADTTRTPAARSYLRWRSYLESALSGTSEGELPSTPRPPEFRDPVTLLSLRQSAIPRIAPALDLIRRGNQKPVVSPYAELKGELLFPELGEFRNLARLSSDAIFAHSAAGATDRAVETFAQMRVMSDNLSNLTLIHFLVGMACEVTITTSIFKQRATWSLADAQRIEAICNEILNREPAISRAAKGEHALSLRFVSDFLSGPEALAEAISFEIEGETPTEAERELLQRLRRFTPPQMNALRARVLAKAEEKHAKVLQILAGPEKDWVSSLQALAPPSFNILPTIRDEAALLDFLASTLTNPIYPESATAAITRRTQTRLLRLYARAVAYRWTNDRWPKAFGEFATPADQQDPSNGGVFVFNRPNDETVEIYSSGTRETGRIDVTSVAQRGTVLPGPSSP